MIRTVVLCNLFVCGVLLAQNVVPSATTKQSSTTSQQAGTAGTTPAGQATRVHYQHDRFTGRAGRYYRFVWGVDSLSVKWAESGEMIRFSYSVIDPEKAKTLSNKRLEPSLVDEKAHVTLVVPTMDKVGKLRQTAPPEAGKTYWMLFSNKGRYVKRGDRVNVVIGNFHANGLVVD
jgi:hypothetical protein